ncbi:MAG: hypothetical protein HYV63_14260 [Candidatus Schekmanbacteria bacterium]|nr:hypothetical protein [Candidatus Schekmanbacteria bacterium]
MTGSLDQNFDLKKDELSWRTVAGLKRAATWLKLSGYVDAAARPVILEAFKSVSGNVLVDFAADQSL